MPWTRPTLRSLREMFRDDIDAHLPGADARVPHSILRELGDASASQTDDMHDHLEHIAKMVMPDTAEGEFAERWGNIWLPDGRKQATQATGSVTVSGEIGSQIATGAVLVRAGAQFEVVTGVTLTTTAQDISVRSVMPGVDGNLGAGVSLSFEQTPAGMDSVGTVAAPGFAGGADRETDEALIGRYLEVIQKPPHGGAEHDYPIWAKQLAGVTDAWAYPMEMGIGTMTVRVLLRNVRSDNHGLPTQADLDLLAAHLATVRPVTVADLFLPSLTAVPLDFTLTRLAGDTPETRTAIETEIEAMLRVRAKPGQTIYASWVSEAISIATGEDSHDLTMTNLVPANNGEIVVPGTITWPS